MKIRLLYFASLADCAGRASEEVESAAVHPSALFAEVGKRHGFAMDATRLRVAVNGKLVDWLQPLADGDEVVFLPPVSGG